MDSSDQDSRELTRDHVAALDVLRHAKNVFFWLAVISVVAHVGSWYVARHTTLLDAAVRLTTIDPDGGDAAGPTEADMNAADRADRWRVAAESSLALGGFVGRASVVMLFALYVLSLLVCLSARVGGAAGMAKACVWSLLALAMLVPWDRLTSPEVSNLPAAFFTMDELNGAGDAALVTPVDGDAPDRPWIGWVRFCIYPLLLGVVVIVGQLSYRGGYRKLSARPGARLPMREV